MVYFSNNTFLFYRRLQRTSKVRALDQVKAWCGAEDGEPAAKKVKKELSSEDEDYSDPDSTKGKNIHTVSASSLIVKQVFMHNT